MFFDHERNVSLESSVPDVELPFFRFGVTLGFGFPNRVLDLQSGQLFELVQFLEVSEVQILQYFLTSLLLQSDDGFVPLRVEGLR